MAIYHFHAGFISRSTGRSAVQAVAYITGERMYESRRGIVADYSGKKSRVLCSGTIAPDHAPEWMKDFGVWDKVELFEDDYAHKRYRTDESREKYLSSAQTAQTYVGAFPKELSPEVWKEIAEDYITRRFKERNLVSTYAIHNDEGNPHLHIEVTRRQVTPEGEFSWAKDREITTKKELTESRKIWADVVNAYLEREGVESRIDHRSFAELGVSFEPTQHEGWYARDLESRNEPSRISIENQEITQRNQQIAAMEPEAILDELSKNQATFGLQELARAVQKRVGDDQVLCRALFEHLQNDVQHVGVSLDGIARYSTKQYVETEKNALSYIDKMLNKKCKTSIPQRAIEAYLERPNDKGFMLNQEQQNAVRTLSGSTNISVLLGRAGTGKTTALQTVVALHKKAGFKVLGGALAAVAADNLGNEAKCSSETLASYIGRWEAYDKAVKNLKELRRNSWQHVNFHKQEAKLLYTIAALKRHQLSSKHLLIIDEAGMVGTPTWEKILHYAHRVNSKVIAVGDDQQFKAIEAGDFFRKLVDISANKGISAVLRHVVRQKESWMREASLNLAEFNTATALSMYENHGHIVALGDGEIIETIASEYVRCLKEEPNHSGILLASTNDQVHALNAAVREELLLERTVSPKDGALMLNKREYAVGDKIVFLKNDREKKITVYTHDGLEEKDGRIRNGTVGYIKKIEKVSLSDRESGNENMETYKVSVALGDDRKADFYLKDYSDFMHGYALTLHKSQGLTVDWSMILASKNMDAHASYVALTRHRRTVKIYYNKDEFETFNALSQSMGRIGKKDLVIDYTIEEQHSQAWRDVQEYLSIGREMMLVAELKDWSAFKDLKLERQLLGKHLLESWDEHKDFVRQAGISKETIAINSGIKPRPLSLAEQKAQITVEHYAVVAMKAREVWSEISRKSPGALAKTHPKYELYDQLRAERGSLANVIAASPAVHRLFMRDYSSSLGYGMATVQKQAEAYQRRLVQERLREEIRDPEQRKKLENIEKYIHARDLSAQTWQRLKQELKEVEGTLIPPMLSSEIDHVHTLFKERDILAHQIIQDFESYNQLAQSIKLSLVTEKLFLQAERGEKLDLIEKYSGNNNGVVQGKAAFDLVEILKHEQKEGSKSTVRELLQAGINLKKLAADANLFKRQQLMASLEDERAQKNYRLLDQYQQLKETANAHYRLCAEDSEEKNIKPWESDYFKAFSAISRDRDAVAAAIISEPFEEMNSLGARMEVSLDKVDIEAHRHDLRQKSDLFLGGMGAKSAQAALELQEWLHVDRDMGSKHTIRIMHEMQYLPKDVIDHLMSFEKRLQKRLGQNSTRVEKEYSNKKFSKTLLSRKEMNEQLASKIDALCMGIFGKPKSPTARQWRYGSKGSVCIFVSGPKQGLYTNFETGVSGPPLKIIEDHFQLTPNGALEWARGWLEQSHTLQHSNVVHRVSEKVKETKWTPVLPVPVSAGEPNIESNKYLSYMLNGGRKITSVYTYRDQKGQTLGYVVRIEDKDGKKITPTLTFCQNEKGQQYWRWSGFGKNKPLYGLDRLGMEKPILIVEGEKAADAAQKLLPAYSVLSWPGGAAAVGSADWTPLHGKEVTIWPDNDSAGFRAAEKIKDILTNPQNAKCQARSVKIVDLPRELPEKWDLADELPADLSLEQVKSLLRSTRLNRTSEGLDPSRDVIDTVPLDRKSAPFVHESIEAKIVEDKHAHLDKKMHEATGRGYHDYNQAMSQFLARYGKEHSKSENALPASGKPLHEIEGQAFLDHYRTYEYERKANKTTPEKKAAFEKYVVEFSKNEKALNYVKMRNREVAKNIERLAKDLQRQAQQNRLKNISFTRH
ncbi:MAG: AAA family ATPase [Holosporales bacterium]